MIHVFCNLEEEEESGHAPMCDMTFDVTRKSHAAASGWSLTCQAYASPGRNVGFHVDVPITGWSEQIDHVEGEAFRTFWGRVELSSIGGESDNLLHLLADYYGVALEQNQAFVTGINCLCVGIHSDPVRLADEPVHMKIFFEDDTGRYAEVFLDVDLPNGLVGLNEKDEGYRQDLIAFLSQGR